MRFKVLLIFVLAFACFLGEQIWTLWVQPELVTDVALRQMERNGQAAPLMRSVNQVQQWPVLAMMSVFVVGAALILWPYRHRAETSRFARSSQPMNEETLR